MSEREDVDTPDPVLIGLFISRTPSTASCRRLRNNTRVLRHVPPTRAVVLVAIVAQEVAPVFW